MLIEDAKSCCMQLDSTRITDRKKGRDQLMHLLNNETLVAILNDKSAKKDNFDWNQIFHNSRSFFIKEAQRLEEQERKKEEASATTISNRNILKLQAGALPVFVLKKASKNVPHIKVKLVLELVTQILSRDHSYLLENFCNDALQIIDKFILRFPEYYLNVPVEKWQVLVRMCIWVYEHDVPRKDIKYIIRVLEGIVRSCKFINGSTLRMSPFIMTFKKIPAFLSTALTSQDLSSNHALQTSLIGLLLEFCSVTCSEWRSLLCGLGEVTWLAVMNMWENIDSPRQIQLLQYFNLQLLMHDPHNEGFNPSGSSYSQDSVTWRRCKHRLYQLVHDHLDELSQRHKMSYHGNTSAGRALLCLEQPLLDLAARLCHQIFQETEGYGVLEITQAGQTQAATQQNNGRSRGPNSHAKRRRVEVGWDPLITWLKDEGTATHMGPWYQILHEMLHRFPAFFDSSKCIQILDLFSHLLAVCKTPQIQEQILRCLNSLALPYSSLQKQLEEVNDKTLTNNSWASVADLTHRLISGKQCNIAGLELIASLLKTDLILPDVSLYRIFYKGHVESNTNALQTLGLVLNRVSLPKKFKSGNNLQSTEMAQDSLFNALLPLQTDEEAINGNCTTQLAILDDPRMLGTILVSLCYRTPKYSKKNIWRILEGDAEKPISNDSTSGSFDEFKELEELYLISSFSLDSFNSQMLKQTNHTEDVKEANVVPELKEKLIIHLIEVIKQYLNARPDEGNSLSDYVRRLIPLVQLITTVLHHNQDDRLVNEQKKIIQELLSGIIKILGEPESTRWTTLLPHINSITKYLLDERHEYKNNSNDNHQLVDVQKVFVSTMQPQIFNNLLVQIKTRAAKPTVPLNQSQASQSFARASSSLSNFDPDFDDIDESSVGRMDDFELINDDFTRESSTNDVPELQAVDDVNSLSVRDQCHIAALRWLVYGTSAAEVEQQADNEDLVSPLLDAVDTITDLTDQPRLDYADITMVLSFVEALFVDEYSGIKVEEGCSILSKMCSKHSSDSQVAARILQLIRDLIGHHGNMLNADLKETVVMLVRGMAVKQYKYRNYGIKVDKAIYNINAELTKIDPDRSWSLYKVEGAENCGFLYAPLGASQHKIRIMAARNIHLLLKHENGAPLSGDQQSEIFEKVYQSSLEALTAQGEVPAEMVGDEGSNVVASFLLSIGIMAQSSRFLEKKALFALCIAIPERGIKDELVARVITKIASSKGLSLEDYMKKHLPYVSQQWLKHNLSLTDFPVNLLQCSNLEEFVTKNLKVLTSVCLDYDTRNGSASTLPTISILSEASQKSPVDLYAENLPLLFAHIFPFLAAESQGQHDMDLRKVKSARVRWKLLENSLGSDVLHERIEKHLGLIALNLCGLCHNPSSMEGGEVVVEPNPPHFTPELIKDTFTYCSTFFGDNNPGKFIDVMCRSKAIHELLQGLLQCIDDCNCETSSRLALDSITIIVDLVALYLPNELQEVCHYPVRSITHILTFYTEKLIQFAPHLANKCNALLYSLWSSCLKAASKIASRNLPLLVSRMIPQCSVKSLTKDSAFKVLTLIMKSQVNDIQETLASLPYFPNKDGYEALSEIRESHLQIVARCRNEPCLSDEVELFLSKSTDFTHSYDLKNLQDILNRYQIQIRNIFIKTDMENSSLGHTLIHRLVKIASKGNREVAIEACKCIGELGPVHLGTPVFLVVDDEHTENDQIGKIITILHGYLVSESYSIVKASCMALEQMLGTSEGFQAIQTLNKDLKNDLRPLRGNAKSKAVSSSGSNVGSNEYKQMVSDENVWYGNHSYNKWICSLVTLLIEAGCSSDAIMCTLPLCRIKPAFSAMMLPFVVHSALKCDTIGRRDILSHHVEKFFSLHVGSNDEANTNDITQDKAAVQDLLNVIDYLRLEIPEQSFSRSSNRNVSPWERNLWLELDYLQVAKAAQFCGAHFSSLLYIELYCESLRKKVNEDENNERQMQDQFSPLQQFSHLPTIDNVRSLLLQVYNSLEDSDGVEGCGLYNAGVEGILNYTTRSIRHKHRGQWLQTLAIHDAANSTQGVVAGLQHLGLYSTVDSLISSVNQRDSPELQEAQLECAWRLGKWDSEITSNQKDLTNLPFTRDVSLSVKGSNASSFHSHLFGALQCLNFKDQRNFPLHIQLGYEAVAHQLQQNTAESSNCIYPLLSQLQLLSETESAAGCITHASTPQLFNQTLDKLERLWSAHDRVLSDCYYQEPILAGRVSVLKALNTSDIINTSLPALLHERLISKVRIWRSNTKSSSTFVSSAAEEASLRTAASLPLSIEQLWMTQMEAARVAQFSGDLQQASQSLSLLLQDINKVSALSISQQQILSQVFNLYGNVLMESRKQPPATIINNYYLKAIKMLEEKEDLESKNILETSYHNLGSYADKLYREVHKHLESDIVVAKRENIRKTAEEIHQVKVIFQKSSDENERKEINRKNTILSKNSTKDENYIEDLKRQETVYLHQSLNHYTRCVKLSSKHDLHMFRIVALWLENLKDGKTTRIIHDSSKEIQTYKYVALIYQLVARLTKIVDSPNHHKDFPQVIFSLLDRMCVDHPHHCLSVVMALAHAHVDEDLNTQKSAYSRKKSKNSVVAEEERVQAAKLLVDRLKKRLPEHVSEMEKVCSAYLHLANYCGKDVAGMAPGTKIDIPNNMALCKLKNLKYCASLTQPVAIQPSAEYSPPLIVSWDSKLTLVGGINVPKRLTQHRSDGTKSFELLKGKDDIRQDAVMEQVFGIVNKLLLQNRETRERSLSIRTYQAVPLSQRSGLIQWVDNTQPFNEYVIGNDRQSGAHKTYYPNDLKANECRKKMAGTAKSGSSDNKLQVFMAILKRFRPVFRHFFFENFPSPHKWYEKRLAYTRSVATNSMVGYILGLGDRHLDNILLDKKTAELVHIDLGIAFEMGQILPTPETIPFRLTQDIVDGLGVLGVEGPMRACCESTLEVLRNSGEVLVTIVEVLKHDPLHQWTLSPHQIARLQKSDEEDEDHIESGGGVSMADRVVLRVQQKLAGVEDGYARTVQEQVTVLLQQAMDISNLSRLFAGWQAYV